MSRRSSIALVALVALVATSAGGCGPDQCAAADLDCVIEHLAISVGGERVPTRTIAGATLNRLRTGGGSDGGVPGVADMRSGTPTAPTMIGCYVDESPVHDLTGRSMSMSNLTVESCNAFCGGYGAFAVEDRTWCFCGDQYGRYGAAPVGDCYMSCAGNTSETCGGFLRENVYTTAPTGVADMTVGGVADMRSGGGTTGGGGGTVGGAPSVTTTVTKISVTSPDQDFPVPLSFDDPNGCTPSFCFSACSPHVMCSAHTVCTHTQRDGLVSGVWRSALGTRYEPAEEHTTLDFQITPAATPDCQDFAEIAFDAEASGMFTVDLDIEIGGVVSIEADITGSVSSSGGGGGLGTTCSGWTADCNCSMEACSDGTRAWYQTGDGQYFYCASISDCTSAATALTNYCCPTH